MASIEARIVRGVVAIATGAGLLRGSNPVDVPVELRHAGVKDAMLVAPGITPHEIVTGYAPDGNRISIECEASDWISEQSRVVNVFGPLSAEFARRVGADAETLRQQGKVLMVSLGEAPSGKRLTYEDLVAREDEIIEIARQFDSMDNAVARFLYEPNGWWFSYGTQVNTPKEFHAMWAFMAKIFRQHAPNTKLVLSLNVTRPDQQYPIEDYLWPQLDYDAIGLDGYVFEYRVGPFSIVWPDQSMVEVFLPDIERIRLYTNAPIIITEVGHGTAPEDWYRDGLTAMGQLPPSQMPTGLFFFNWNKTGPGEGAWGLELEAARDGVADGFAAGGYYDGPAEATPVMEELFGK